MALFKITVKRSGTVNNIRLEAGMRVEVVSNYSNPNPVTTNNGHQVVEAFERKYGIDIKRAGGLTTSVLNVEKL